MISTFEDLLRAAREQPDAQRLLLYSPRPVFQKTRHANSENALRRERGAP